MTYGHDAIRMARLRHSVARNFRIDPEGISIEFSEPRQAPVAHLGGLRFTDVALAGQGLPAVYEIVDDRRGSFDHRWVAHLT